MLASRQAELLEGIAQDLFDCNAPLNHQFLVEHDVSFDECMATSELLGYLFRGWCYAPPIVQSSLLVTGAAWPALPGDIVFDAVLDTSPTARPSTRTLTLMRGLARDCLAFREAFSHQFLVRHNVLASECIDLSQQAGCVIRGWLHAAAPARDTVLICGVAGKVLPSEFVFSASLQQHLLKKLKALRLPAEIAPALS